MRTLRFALIAIFAAIFLAGPAATAAPSAKLLLTPPPIAQARTLQPQGINWQEQRTTHFAILYAPGDEQNAGVYAGFVDNVYEELATLFSHRPETPITLRLYNTLDSYYAANPQAQQNPGIVAHADFRRREVVVVLPQTAAQSPVEVQNNVRHELTHLIAGELSDNRLNTGFQEAIAQYVEHPAGELETRVALLRRAIDAGQLLRWSDTDNRTAIYASPEVGYPQMLSIAAFLVERDGFGKLRDFLTISARSSGYRSALERAYGVSPDALEQEWLAWLPSYLEGGYRRSAVSSYDLSHARELLLQGRYAESRAELERALQWLDQNAATSGTEGTVVQGEARTLLEQSAVGEAAEQAAADARAALENGEYERARGLVVQARTGYEQLGDTRQNEVLAAFADRAQRGAEAEALLNQAYSEAQALRYPQARASAEQAGALFAALGDAERASQSGVLSRTLNSRQTLLGFTLLALGLGGVAGSLLGRWRTREAEVW